MDNKEIINAIHAMQLDIGTKLATHTEKLGHQSDKLDILFDKLEETAHTLYGVGGKEDGITTRVKLIEKTEENRKYTIRSLFVMVVGIVGKVLYDLFKG